MANNIPNIYRDLRIHLLDEIYYLKKNLLYAQCNRGNIRIKYITEMIVNISMLDLISDDINEYCPKIKKKLKDLKKYDLAKYYKSYGSYYGYLKKVSEVERNFKMKAIENMNTIKKNIVLK